MKLKPPTVLYWIDGAHVTPEHQKDAFKYGPNVRFRNAQHDTKDGFLEPHDYVAGPAIPARYTDATVKLQGGAEVPNPNRREMAVPFAEWAAKSVPDNADDFTAKAGAAGNDAPTAASKLAVQTKAPQRTKGANEPEPAKDQTNTGDPNASGWA